MTTFPSKIYCLSGNSLQERTTQEGKYCRIQLMLNEFISLNNVFKTLFFSNKGSKIKFYSYLYKAPIAFTFKQLQNIKGEVSLRTCYLFALYALSFLSICSSSHLAWVSFSAWGRWPTPPFVWLLKHWATDSTETAPEPCCSSFKENMLNPVASV